MEALMTEAQKTEINRLFIKKGRQEQKVIVLLQQDALEDAIIAYSMLLGATVAIGDLLNSFKEPIMDEEE